jgi:hypothetical protein
MAINHNILYSLLHSNMEAQAFLVTVHLGPPEDYEQGPVTPENVRPRRIMEFARNLNNIRNAHQDERLRITTHAADKYGRAATAASASGDRGAEADYKAYEGILNSIVTQSI